VSIPGRVIVFDYGEVISRSPSAADRAEILTIASSVGGVAPVLFWESYERHRDALDLGALRVPAYWAAIADDLGVEWTPSEIHRLWASDFRSWISVDTGTVDLLEELASGGTRLAILSNAGFDFAGPLTFSPIGQYFERIFVSAELDLLKPDTAIYLRVAAELGITPAEMVFVDNKSVNTDAAAALGITTHHFTGSEGLRRFLDTLAS
jgi:putative hydrolase of the HAD superfamily